MPDLKIKGLIELLLKGKGAKDAAKQVDNVDKSAKKAEKSLKKAGTAGQQFGAKLRQYLGGAVLFAFVKSAISAFANWERQLKATAGEARGLGLDVQATVQHTRDLTTAIEQQTGILRQDTTPVFNKFLGLTQDTQAATLLLRAAVGAEEKQFKDLATAANLLGSILQGEVIEPSKSLGLAFDQTRDSAEQQAEVLDQAISKFLDLSDTAGDTKSELDGIGATANATRLTLGEQLAPAIGVVNKAFSGFIKIVQITGAAIGTVVGGIVQAFIGVGRAAKAAFNIKLLFTDPKTYLQDLTDVIAGELELQLANLKDYSEESTQIWKGTAKEITQTEEQEHKAREALLAAANARAARAREVRLRKEAEAFLKAEVDKYQRGSLARFEKEIELLQLQREHALAEAGKTGQGIAEINTRFDAQIAAKRTQRAEQLAEIERRAQESLLQARIEAADDGSQAELDAQLAALEYAKTQAIEKARETGASELALKEMFQIAEERLRDQYRKDRTKKDLDNEREIARRVVQIAQETLDAETELAQARLERQLESNLLTAQGRADLEAKIRDERHRAELERIELEKQAEIDAIREVLEAKIEAEPDPKEKAKLQDALNALIAKSNDKWGKITAAANTRRAAEEERDARALAQAKIDLAQQVGTQVIGALSALFGENKAFAIGQAVLDTWAAVNRTLASLPFPANVIAAAAVAAQGLANVQKIRSAQPGSSGGGGGVGGGAGAARISTTPSPAPPPTRVPPPGPPAPPAPAAAPAPAAPQEEPLPESRPVPVPFELPIQPPPAVAPAAPAPAPEEPRTVTPPPVVPTIVEVPEPVARPLPAPPPTPVAAAAIPAPAPAAAPPPAPIPLVVVPTPTAAAAIPAPARVPAPAAIAPPPPAPSVIDNSQVVYQNAPDTVINNNFKGGLYGGKPGLKELSREIERAKRRDQARFIR